MRIALIGPELEENLALRYLASSLEAADHECRIFPFNSGAEVSSTARKVLAFDPLLAGFSLVAQRRFEDFRRLGAALRARGFSGHITAGGHFAGLRAQEIMRDVSEIDSILHHDGEERIVSLARWLSLSASLCRPRDERLPDSASDQEIPMPPDSLDGITWRGPGGTICHRPPRRVPDVDRLPAPKRRRADRTLGFRRAPMVTSRGCSGACAFCSIHAWHRQVPAGRLRFRAPEKVVAEMVALHRDEGTRVFVFHDDDFIHPDPAVALSRCRAILEPVEAAISQPIAFVIKCRPDDVEPDLFAYLKAKGLVRVYVGIESHSEAGIRTLNRRIRPEQNERALAILRDLGIYGCFNLLIFHPETTLAELAENLDFLSRQVMHPFDIARTELYARSTLEERMVREGRAIGDYRGYDYRLADPQAEATFRLFAHVLWERHFGGRSILHRTQDLGYRMSLLRRMLPGMATDELQARVDALIREVNADTVRYVRWLSEYAGVSGETARRGSPLDRPGILALEKEVADRLRQQDARWTALSIELEWRARLGRIAPPSPSFLAEWPRMLGRSAALAPLAALALGLLSCGRDTQVCDPPPPPVNFATEIEPHLDQTCAVTGCHSADADSAGLVLSTGASSSNLVGVPSTQAPRLQRVKAGQPDSSYVVHKLEGTQAQVGGRGERMPKGGQPDQSFISRLRQWILEGANRE